MSNKTAKTRIMRREDVPPGTFMTRMGLLSEPCTYIAMEGRNDAGSLYALGVSGPFITPGAQSWFPGDVEVEVEVIEKRESVRIEDVEPGQEFTLYETRCVALRPAIRNALRTPFDTPITPFSPADNPHYLSWAPTGTMVTVTTETLRSIENPC